MDAHRATVNAAAGMRALRNQRGWTARQLAEKFSELGMPEVTRSIITNLENGRQLRMNLEQAAGLVLIFETTFEWLLCAEGAVKCVNCSDKPIPGFICASCGAKG